LHCHTTRSDGSDTPRELVDHAARLGLHAVAITDHDTPGPTFLRLADGREVSSVDYARDHGVTLILGYEFSCDTLVDDVHICGYSLDWSNPAIQAEVEAAKRSKTEAYEELCRRLTEAGMPINWERDILNTEDGQSAREPSEVQRRHIFGAMARKGYAEDWSAAKILVRDNPSLNVRRRKIDPEAAIELIHRCGGLAVLAHPYLIDQEIQSPGKPDGSREQYIDALLEAGLDGIEASYTYDKTSYKGDKSPEAIEAEVRRRYAGRARFFTGGSDYHGDRKMTGSNIRHMGERGMSVEEFAAIPGRMADSR